MEIALGLLGLAVAASTTIAAIIAYNKTITTIDQKMSNGFASLDSLRMLQQHELPIINSHFGSSVTMSAEGDEVTVTGTVDGASVDDVPNFWSQETIAAHMYGDIKEPIMMPTHVDDITGTIDGVSVGEAPNQWSEDENLEEELDEELEEEFGFEEPMYAHESIQHYHFPNEWFVGAPTQRPALLNVQPGSAVPVMDFDGDCLNAFCRTLIPEPTMDDVMQPFNGPTLPQIENTAMEDDVPLNLTHDPIPAINIPFIDDDDDDEGELPYATQPMSSSPFWHPHMMVVDPS